MPRTLFPEGEFITLFETFGPSETAKRTDSTLRAVLGRRARLEKKLNRSIVSATVSFPGAKGANLRVPSSAVGRIETDVMDGVVLVGSDAHYWPGEPTTAHRAFVKFCKDLQPKIVIKNGDVLDASTISRFPPIGWEKTPSLKDEIEACKDRLGEIVMAAPKAKRYWPLGNHCARFETRLATVAPEYANVHGIHLKDHFPEFEPCWSVWINDDVVVKHRFRGGIHAPHNNTLWSGKTLVTGHLHSQQVKPLSDYNGTRWGVDAGCLAEPYGPQFQYLEDSPRNWRSGFAVLFFDHGLLLQPQLAMVVDEGKIDFCGKIIEV